MMLLLFVIGKDSYGLDVTQVVEVIPYVTLKEIPRAPDYVAGLLNYRGRSVPVVDLTVLMTGNISRAWLSSRIILVNIQDDRKNPHLLALLAERIASTIKLPESAFSPSGVDTSDTGFLGDVAVYQGNIIQLIDIEKLLPVQLHRTFFTSVDETDSAENHSDGCLNDSGD
ncbi:MAG: chemotaxis protein CheW [Gammaproteobacteria bacterium]